ncbi:MAG: hypothetical protein H6978_14835 [Gammaproteobacteria bacterium]|nr:hypothetical protein [Gammaproteobacteria bacterium]
MKRREFNSSLIAAALGAGNMRNLQAKTAGYVAGDRIDPGTFVVNAALQRERLLDLLATDPARKVNVVFVFGGGDMGHTQPGRLWCQDSYEDSHILRTLSDWYRDAPVGFIPIACPPAYHTKWLGFGERVFLDPSDDDAGFVKAREAFMESTAAAVTAGTLPQQPWLDLRFRLLMNPNQVPATDDVAPWQGRMRADDESQMYGVPCYWLLGNDGAVLAPPFRGNVYHPHGGHHQIRYTVADVDRAIAGLLA